MITATECTLKMITVAEACTLGSAYALCSLVAARVACFALDYLGFIQASGGLLSPPFWCLASLHAGCAITFWVLTAIVAVVIEKKKPEELGFEDEIGPAVLIWGAVTLSFYVLSRLGPAALLGISTEAFAHGVAMLYLGLSSLPTLALTGIEFLEIAKGQYRKTLPYKCIYG